MANKYFGDSFDLHTGGIDNLFPHHENEIAQSEGATGKPFVQTWMHCAHLRVNGEKMSKSLGNFYTLRDLIDKGYTGREIRYVLLQAQYRQPLNFTFSGLDDARKALSRIDDFVARLGEGTNGTKGTNGSPASLVASPATCHKNPSVPLVPSVPSVPFATAALTQFSNALADDLNLPEAFAALFNLIREGNAALDKNLPTDGVLATLREMDRVLAVIFVEKSSSEIPPDILALRDARALARAEKRWADSDTLRDQLRALGWEVRDGKDGQTLKKT